MYLPILIFELTIICVEF